MTLLTTSLVWIAVWCSNGCNGRAAHCHAHAKAFDHEVKCLEFIGERKGADCLFSAKGFTRDFLKAKGYR